MAKAKHAATFLGGSKSLVTLGDHVYAYSGDLTLANATIVTALDFTTGKQITTAKLQTSVDADALSTNYLRLFVTFNGVSIIYNLEQRGAGSPSGDVMYLTIPPLTEVIVKVQGAANAVGTAWLTGRVYDA